MERRALPQQPESFWRRTSHVKEYPPLEKDLKVDVAVIGGGIAGILAAYELKKAGKNVALFEARKLIGGTTGYTTAKLTAQHDLIYNDLIARYGEEKARRFYDANMEGIAAIQEIVEEYQIDCELQAADAYAYTTFQSRRDAVEKEAAAYRQLDISGELIEELPVDLNIAAAIVMPGQYQFHPVRFLAGVLAELEKMEVSIYEETLITEIEDGEEVIVKTEAGLQITCHQAVCASHYPVDDPDNFYAKNMQSSMSLATIYRQEEEFPGGMYISYDRPGRTFRAVDVNSRHYLLVGGEGHIPGEGKSELTRYGDIAEFAEEVFHTKEVLAYWSAHDYKTKDRLPFAGRNPSRQNIFVITGLSKWGLASAARSAKLLSHLIEGAEDTCQELFDPERQIPAIKTTDVKVREREPDDVQTKDKIKNLAGGQVVIYKKDDKKFGAFKDFDGNIHYLELTCTHLGCELGWNDAERTWDCPCHGSRFTATGEVAAGPALKALELGEREDFH